MTNNRLGLIAGVCLGVTSSVHAAPVRADFSQGTLGNLGTLHIIQDIVSVQAFGGNLYRWNQFETCDGLCVPHEDRGLGVLSADDEINPAQPELNQPEALRLLTPFGWRFVALGFSSVNNLSELAIYAHEPPFGAIASYSVSVAQAVNSFVHLPLGAQESVLWIVPSGSLADNYSLLHYADLEPQGEPIPEPGTLALLLLGGFVGVSLRRLRHA